MQYITFEEYSFSINLEGIKNVMKINTTTNIFFLIQEQATGCIETSYIS